ncbi:type IV pilin N-terminal domain-containing protein [Haloglomus litoreum]|uniref:type IV pilin N-terminal domain-containing protein n=1 Tax=Haloglomus litoreum TaxID=3034026 RepID=UPI0023E895D9|nr:type IV pilin N-terminal domain-containing protein [Haloglomus sp. DT116]
MGSRGPRALVERAVSPVIGVVLMVAIVVILAATMGVFAMGFGDDPATPQPNIDFTFEFHDDVGDNGEDALDIVHDGGETVEVADGSQPQTVAAGDLYIVADYPYEDDTLAASGFECGSPSGGQYECSFNFDDEFAIPGDSMSAGERFRIYGADPSTEFEKATVRIVYKPEDGTRSYVLATWEGPEAGN